MSFTACYLRDIALLVVDFHNIRAKLFQYSPDIDEELSDKALQRLDEFSASAVTRKKVWFDKIKQLLGELQKPNVLTMLEHNMHRPLRLFVKGVMQTHGWTADEIESVLPQEVQARNYGAYLRHMYRMCGDLSFSFTAASKSTPVAEEKGVYVEHVPDGIVTAEPEDSNPVEAPDYNKLEDEVENLETDSNAPNTKPAVIEVEQSSATEHLETVNSAPRDVPKLIKNLNSTCYMSSVLQMLTALPEITSLCLTEPSLGSSLLTPLVRQLFANDGNDYLYPRKFQAEFAAMRKSHRRFRIGEQQDAHEYLVHLIDALPSALNQLFKIELSYSITCQNCQHVEKDKAELFDLPLDIKPSGPNQLDEMLGSFLSEPVEEWYI